MNEPTNDPVAEAKERIRQGKVPHKVVLTIRQTAQGIRVTCQPPFEKLKEFAAAKTMAPVEAYAWNALSSMRQLSAKLEEGPKP